jgi:hypothetical protein
MIRRSPLIGIFLVGFFLASTSNAAPTHYTINGGSPIAFGSIPPDIFQGSASLSKSCLGAPINLNCTLTLSGEVYKSGSSVQLRIDTASSTGPGLCTNVGFTNLPWYSSTFSSSPPDSFLFTVSGIGVSTSCGSCSGSLNASFANTGLGEFSFSGTLPGGFLGDCIVNGTGIDSSPAGSGNTYRMW